MTKVLEAASPALAAPLQPKSELEVSKLKLKLANAGFRSEAAPTIFLGFKFLGLMVGLCLGGGDAWPSRRDASQKRAVTAVLFAGGLFYLPQTCADVA